MALIDLDLDRAPAAATPHSRERARWTTWTLTGVFTVVAVLTHLPGLLRRAVLNPDEGFLAVQAKVLNAGGRLYLDVVDRKPPLVPLVYAALFRLTGSDALISLRLLAVVSHVVAAVLLAAIARRRWDDRAGLAAGLLYLVAATGFLPADGQAANFEVFMVPLTCAAVLLAQRDRPVGAGVFVALSTLAKQVGGATLLPVAWLTWQRSGRRGLLRVTAAFVVPILGTAVFYGFGLFISWVFTGSNSYLDPSGSWTVSLRRGIEWTLIFAAANLAAVLLLAPAWSRRREDVDLWLWLLGAAVGVSAGLRFFGHYYLQLAPPLALLAAGALHAARPAVRARTAVLGALSVVVFLGIAVSTEPTILRPTRGVAAEIGALSRPGEPMFVWGEVPQLYLAAERPPATRFLTVGFLTGYSGGRANNRIGTQYAVDGAWRQLWEDLAAHPPAVIVDESQGTPFPLERFPDLQRYVVSRYRVAAVIDGAVVYARSSGA